MGAGASGSGILSSALRLPSAALIAFLMLLLAIPILINHWRIALAVFLSWLVVEDLIRKLAGNELWVYFVKDAIFLLVVLSLLTSSEAQRVWGKATGRARLLLYALLAWALIMSVPSGLQDLRLPLVGLRLDFLYAPLVVGGSLIASRESSLRRWLSGLALLGGLASMVGIVQAVVGPSFLAPESPVPGLRNLVLVRGLPGSGLIYRPTGTFVDPGRFDSMALIALAVGLAVFLLGSRQQAYIGVACSGIAAAALWVSGGRTVFLGGVFLLAVALLASGFRKRSPARWRSVVSVGSAAVAVIALVTVFPAVGLSRSLWYRETLSPRALNNEWPTRWGAFSASILFGVQEGGLIGRGTGTQSLGRQYLYEGNEEPPLARSVVEGGYAAVAIEWGWMGVVLWVSWSVGWSWRQWRSVLDTRGSPLARTKLVLFGWVFFFLFLGFFGGFQSFQNYVGNAYFWLVSGMIFTQLRPEQALSSRPGKEIGY